ncbi:hypothetical protein NQ314_019184 [Rhamnusium bicolor]|uniref:Epsilon-sarcoglycan n=1 Tax=Rhamnusium bicolor TaxID=1586634 RepID=A0AAV8WP76_9CUCU|nr:hypothetical protein NQ314_019184 [Rhamnusium bicolor]
MLIKLLIISFFGLKLNYARDIHVLMTEVFEIEVNPSMFNWTYEQIIEDQYVYQASLLNAPDLPSWINFVYSKKNHSGFLYGVPPKKIKPNTPIEIVALNKKNYETRIEKLNIIVTQKLSPAKYEVHMKIDNLNVEDMFDVERMTSLKAIFREQLWKDSENDLYLTFLSSAIELGARKPLIPSEKEGCVHNVTLLYLIGLWCVWVAINHSLMSSKFFKMKLDHHGKYLRVSLKRTTVERIFRDAKFTLDWCSFRLIDNNSGMHQPGANEKLLSVDEENLNHDYWQPISKSDLPPTGHVNNIPSEEINQFGTLQRATESIRSFSKTREMNLSPDPMLISRSHTNSPTSTISRGVHCRPSPPPYVRPKFKPEL